MKKTGVLFLILLLSVLLVAMLAACSPQSGEAPPTPGPEDSSGDTPGDGGSPSAPEGDGPSDPGAVTPPVTYTITFTADAGGSVSGVTSAGAPTEAALTSGSAVTKDVQVTLTATPNEGYVFVGWTENSTTVSTDAAYTFAATASRTLVASFKENTAKLTLTAEAGGTAVAKAKGTDTEIPTGSDVRVGAELTLAATPSYGYRFLGFYVAGQNTPIADATTDLTMTAAGITVTAKFEKVSNTVSFTAGAGGSVSAAVGTNAIQSGDSVVFGSLVTLTATPDARYRFDGWQVTGMTLTDPTAAVAAFTMDISALTFEARFSLVPYTLIFAPYTGFEGGSVALSSGEPSGSELPNGRSLTLTATPATGYRFLGFFEADGTTAIVDGVSNNTYTFAMPEAAKTVYVKFERIKNTVTFTAGMGGTVSGTAGTDALNSGDEVAFGEQITLTATPATGYRFVGWYDANGFLSGNATYTDTMRLAALEIEATFEKVKSTLTFIAGAGGTVAGTAGADALNSGSPVEYGTQLTLTASAANGYDFVGWFRDGGTDPIFEGAVLEIAMPEVAMTLEAKFAPKTYNVYYFDGSTLIGTDTGTFGVVFTAEPKEKADHKFFNWFIDSDCSTSYTAAPMTGDLYLYGEWTPDVVRYSVVFKDADGRQIGSTQQVEAGSAAILPGDPVPPDGYYFVSWDSNAYLSVNEPLVITAIYGKCSYNVRFWLDAEKTEQFSATQSIQYLEKVDIPNPAPTRDGKLFVRWMLGDYPYTFESAVTGPLDLVAEWIDEPVSSHSVKFFDINGVILYEQTVEDGGDATAPNAPAVVGKKFAGWEGSFTDVSEDREIRPIYVTATYTVRFFANGKQIGEALSVEHDGTAPMPAEEPQKTGHLFKGYDKSNEGITEDTDFTAVFEPLTFTATYYGKDGALLPTLAETVNYGGYFKTPVAPSVEGFSFIGWFDETGVVAFDFTAQVEANAEIYAFYAENKLPEYTVIFLDRNDQIIDRPQSVAEGHSAIAPAAPAETGWKFIGWDTEDYKNVTGALTVRALYTEMIYTVTFYDKDGNELGTASVKYGHEPALSEIPTPPTVPGKEFSGWSNSFSPVLGDMSTYAQYDDKVVNVYFYNMADIDDPEKTEICRMQTVAVGGYVSIPDTQILEGKVFVEWQDAEGNTFSFTEKVTAEEDFALYAVYEDLTGIYTVYFEDYDGNVYHRIRVPAGETVQLPAPPEAANGEVFDHFVVVATGTVFDGATVVTRSLTVRAVAATA